MVASYCHTEMKPHLYLRYRADQSQWAVIYPSETGCYHSGWHTLAAQAVYTARRALAPES